MVSFLTTFIYLMDSRPLHHLDDAACDPFELLDEGYPIFSDMGSKNVPIFSSRNGPPLWGSEEKVLFLTPKTGSKKEAILVDAEM